MRGTTHIALLVGFSLVFEISARPLFAQACKDDEVMTNESKKSVGELVVTVKKESLPEFNRAYHQRSSLSRLTISLSAVTGLVSCLEKAAQDTTATPEDLAAYKAKLETYSKLKGKIDQDRKALRGASDAKEAKALIEKFDLAD